MLVHLIQAQERQEELEAACEHLKEQQEAVESLKTLLSEQSGELASMRAELETSNTRLQEKVLGAEVSSGAQGPGLVGPEQLDAVHQWSPHPKTKLPA